MEFWSILYQRQQISSANVILKRPVISDRPHAKYLYFLGTGFKQR